MKTAIFKTLVAVMLVLSFGTVESKAMGDRELGALIGIGGLMIFNNITSNHGNQRVQEAPRYERTYNPPIVYERAPTYRTYRNEDSFRRTYIIQNNYYEKNNNYRSARRSNHDRRRH